MNQPIHDNKLNRVLLKPRFKMEMSEDEITVLNKFKDQFDKTECNYCGKIIDHHVVIDVPKEDDHFWSPQLHLEIEKDEENKTVVKGLFGPKPTVWTMFMFVHFAVAAAFFAFLVVAYTKWNLKQEYTLWMYLCIAMPILWIVLYFLGQLGKKKGYQQMLELDDFMKKILRK